MNNIHIGDIFYLKFVQASVMVEEIQDNEGVSVEFNNKKELIRKTFFIENLVKKFDSKRGLKY